MIEYHYTIPGNPVTKKNSQRIIVNRKTGKPMILPSEKYKQYEETAGWYFRERPSIESPCNVAMRYYMIDKRRADLANLEEATLDIMVHYGVLKDDNYKIVRTMDGSSVEVDGRNPRVEITITVEEKDVV